MSMFEEWQSGMFRGQLLKFKMPKAPSFIQNHRHTWLSLPSKAKYNNFKSWGHHRLHMKSYIYACP
jgi:hypothetical protein